MLHVLLVGWMTLAVGNYRVDLGASEYQRRLCEVAWDVLDAEAPGQQHVQNYLTCLMVAKEAEEWGEEEAVLVALAWAESRFTWDRVSRKGAVGPLQILPKWSTCLRETGGGCSLITAGVEAFVERKRQVQDDMLAVCHYNSGNVCKNPSYGELVVRTAEAWKQTAIGG